MSGIDGFKALADMNSRSSCPRCEGYGFVHDSPEKHDKSDLKVRCKKCNACKICSGSGVVMGKVPCKPCKARGFLHPPSVHLREHPGQESIRCGDCIDCRDCKGQGVIDKRALQKKLQQQQQQQQQQQGNRQSQAPLIPGFPGAAPGFPGGAPLMMNGMPVPIPIGMPGAMNVNPNGGDDDGKNSVSSGERGSGEFEREDGGLGTGDNAGLPEELFRPCTCPKCDGKGFKHESSSKHDKGPLIRCKTCVNCKACTGTGKVQGKTSCPTCTTKGFIHASTDRGHDAPEKLRCFFCKDCPTCKGVGVVETPEIAEARERKRLADKAAAAALAKAQRRAAKEAAKTNAANQQQQQQLMMMMMMSMMMSQNNPNGAGAGSSNTNGSNGAIPPPPPGPPPGAPAALMAPPPVLPIVMVTHPDGTRVPSVNLPGVGIVPATQIMSMKVPMVAPAGAAGTVVNGSTGIPLAPGIGNVNASGIGTATVPGPPPGPPPLSAAVASQREAVLRDVWG
ncbi:hypothetical protein HDU76_005114 [Blyttiomyces sp. JEL0837]|nr:hypothetical protein HDU76_005114 [Blyttiomyces sp. JEL0837]